MDILKLLVIGFLVCQAVEFKMYKKWATKKAVEFKLLHKYKCEHVSLNELILSSRFGLFKSIQNYNGKGSFTKYAEYYVKGELLKTLTDSFTLSSIDKKTRIKSRAKYHGIDAKPYLMGNDYWRFEPSKIDILDSYLEKEEKIQKRMEVWEKINDLPPFTKRLFHLKYDADFNKIRTNKEVAVLMCCSTEHVRKTFAKLLKN